MTFSEGLSITLAFFLILSPTSISFPIQTFCDVTLSGYSSYYRTNVEYRKLYKQKLIANRDINRSLKRFYRTSSFYSCVRMKSGNEDESNVSDKTLEDKLKEYPLGLGSVFLPDISLPSVGFGAFLGIIASISFIIFAPVNIFFDQSISDSSKMSLEDSVNVFKDILVDLDNSYVDKVDPQKLFKTGVTAMLQSLDPYTEYEDLMAAKAMQEQVSGKYGGVGLVIASKKYGDTPGIEVVDAFEGYAYNEGVRTGGCLMIILAYNSDDDYKYFCFQGTK